MPLATLAAERFFCRMRSTCPPWLATIISASADSVTFNAMFTRNSFPWASISTTTPLAPGGTWDGRAWWMKTAARVGPVNMGGTRNIGLSGFVQQMPSAGSVLGKTRPATLPGRLPRRPQAGDPPARLAIELWLSLRFSGK
jgi:hypothetical protein